MNRRNKTTTKQPQKCAIYVRVSTGEQDVSNQADALKKYALQQNYNIYNIYTDVISGSKSSRPALNDLLNDAHHHQFDVVLVWKLDRLGRSLQHLIKVIGYFNHWGIDFVCITQNFDTTTSSGKLIFQVLGALAEYEREIISERVKLGLKNAKNVGKRGKDKGQRNKSGYYLRYQKKGGGDFDPNL